MSTRSRGSLQAEAAVELASAQDMTPCSGCSLLPGSGPGGLECLNTVRALVSASQATTGLPACEEEWEPPFPAVCWHFQMNLCMATPVPRLSAWSLSCCTAAALPGPAEALCGI